MKTYTEKKQELLLEKLRIQNEILRCKLDREKNLIDFQDTICENFAASITGDDDDDCDNGDECEPPEPIVVFERMERWIVAPYCTHCRAYMIREYDRDSDIICDECGGHINSEVENDN